MPSHFHQSQTSWRWHGSGGGWDCAAAPRGPQPRTEGAGSRRVLLRWLRPHVPLRPQIDSSGTSLPTPSPFLCEQKREPWEPCPHVARLYHHMDQRNRQGLRDLINSGVIIGIMRAPEYDYCWRNFVNYPPGKDTHWPRYPPLWMELYGLELHCIILNLPPCLMISRRCQKQLTWFRLSLQNCHYQMIPPPILLAAGVIQPPVIWR